MQPGSTAAITVADAEVVVDGARILGPISWEVTADQRWVVLGPNGAGKSTLIRLVGGWRLPTRGTVTVLGERFGRTDLRDLRPRVGWISSELDRRLGPASTVLDVLVTGLHGALVRWHHTAGDAVVGRAEALLERLGLDGFAARRYATLSEGERQRTLLARALLPEPELLLLDEPFAALDLGGRELLVSALSDLAVDRNAPPVVLVTHHVEDIPAGFTHCMLLRAGTVSAFGSMAEVVTGERLSAAFDVPVVVEQRSGRFTSRAR